MIVTILSLLVVVFFYTKAFVLINKNVSLNWEIKKGVLCYSCKERTSDNEDDWIYNLDISKEDFKLCTSCERDEKLGSLIYKSDNHKWINRFKRYLVSKKSDKMIFIYVGALFALFFIDLLFHFTVLKNIHIFGETSTVLNILYASLFYYKVKITSGDKKATFKEQN
jgi:hypothetical protein